MLQSKIQKVYKVFALSTAFLFFFFLSACNDVQAGENQKCLISIEGMTCSSCKNTVEEALKGVDGIVVSSVNLETGTAEVTFDPSKTDGEKIAAAVSETGYEASLGEPKEKPE